jgi:hypothetical protein
MPVSKLQILKIIGRFFLLLFAALGLVVTAIFVAEYFGWTEVPGAVDIRSRYFQNEFFTPTAAPTNQAWQTSPEWQTLKVALQKDVPNLRAAAATAGVSPRLIATIVVGEQLRLFTSNREIFKQVFAPLSILGVQTQFSLGVVGLKYDTAKMIEQNLRATSSPFYLGPAYEHVLDFSSANHDQERLNRLIDQHNHYYSYLYTGLYLHQIINQWQKAGFDISHRPEIISTIYNIGFGNSRPNPNPNAGGAEIDLNGTTYTFGGLAHDFYYSNELINDLPS